MKLKRSLLQWDTILMLLLGALLLWPAFSRTIVVYGPDPVFPEEAHTTPLIPADTLMQYETFLHLYKDMERKRDSEEALASGSFTQAYYTPSWGFGTGPAISGPGKKAPGNAAFYFMAGGYLFKDPHSMIKVRNGQKFLYYRDRNAMAGGDTISKKAVAYLFSREQPEANTSISTGKVILEVPRSAYGRLKALYWINMALMLGVAYILLALPLKILIRVSQGKVFSRRNITSLYWIAGTLLFMSWGMILFRYLLDLYLQDTLAGDVHLSFKIMMYQYSWWMLAAIAVLGIAKAFKKGFTLQAEQDLTI